MAPGGTVRAIYRPGTAGLVIYGKATQVLELSAELDPKLLPDKEFAARFAQRFHRQPGPYAAYGYEAMALVLQGIAGAGTDASSFRDDVRAAVIGAHRDRHRPGQLLDHLRGRHHRVHDPALQDREGWSGRSRIATPNGPFRVPLGAPCPPQ